MEEIRMLMDNNPNALAAVQAVQSAAGLNVQPDPKLIHPYTEQDNAASAANPTTIRRYSNGIKSVLYLNASHDADKQGVMHQKIDEAMPMRPTAVVIEAKTGLPTPDGEAGYVERMAQQQGIPVIRAEPDDAKIIEAMVANGHSSKDVMALYLMRMVPQDRKNIEEAANNRVIEAQQRGEQLPNDYVHKAVERGMSEEKFAERAQYFLENNHVFQSIPPSERLSYAEFKEDYAPKLGKPFLSATGNDTAPIKNEQSNFFQNLHADVSIVREGLVNAKIAEALNGADASNVLVVYGGAHRTMSEPVWNAALGKGVNVDAESLQRERPATQVDANTFVGLSGNATRRGGWVVG